jgi:hypothetical protein
MAFPIRSAGQPEAAAAMSQALIDNLAELHLIDVEAAGLSVLGRPAGFLQRQVEGWSERWRRAVTSPVPAMDPVMEWLAAERPEPRRTAMLHQDYKLDNVMFGTREPSRMTARAGLGNGDRGRSLGRSRALADLLVAARSPEGGGHGAGGGLVEPGTADRAVR